MKIKTIDISNREWFDRVNGNSYFAGRVTVNFGMKDCKIIYIQFQYGYGSHGEDVAMMELQKLYPKQLKGLPIWKLRDEMGIVFRVNKQENCLKRDVVAWGREV